MLFVSSSRKTGFGSICIITFLLAFKCQGTRIIFPDENHYFRNKPEGSHTTAANGNLRRTSEVCTTVEGQKGHCLPLDQCPELQKLLASRNGIHTPGTFEYLLKRICRHQQHKFLLCCITETSPPSANPDTLTPAPKLKPMLPTMTECGISADGKIRGGKDFGHGAHPWLVGVGYPVPKKPFKVECGGTLITRKHVLSAAHCFIANKVGPRHRRVENTHVVLGKHQLSTNEEREPPIIRRIAEIKEPGYNETTRYNDIALIVLAEEITFSTFIRPACLPSVSQAEKFQLEDEKVTVAGWGRVYFLALQGTDKPLEANLTWVPNDVCKKAYAFEANILIDKTQICFADAHSDTCRGDSGGPAIYKEKKEFHRYFLLGVVAFGVGCGDPNYPGVYTYVPEYLDWIKKNVES